MRFRRAISWLLMSTLLLTPMVRAQGPSSEKLEDLLAAAHFYVVSYTEWPSKGDLRVCVPNDHRLKESLTTVFSNRVTSQYRLSVSDLRDNKEYEKTCGVVILGNSEGENRTILERLRNQPVLTVSSESDITDQGGMIYLPKGKPPRILLKQVTLSGLRIDSALLAISEIVQ